MQLHHAASGLLSQLALIIEQLPEESFRKKLSILNYASIGQHIRHTIEFFQCLIEQVEQGTINYDHRKHDVVIENDSAIALESIQEIKHYLQANAKDFQLVLEASFSLDEEEISTRCNTSFYRELAYNIEHLVHHMAILKIGIQSMENPIQLPENFGIAASTVRFQNSK